MYFRVNAIGVARMVIKQMITRKRESSSRSADGEGKHHLPPPWREHKSQIRKQRDRATNPALQNEP